MPIDNKTQVLEKLKQHLQTAVMLEMSTLPPYLCAYWSIHGNSHMAENAKKYILSVVQEEMLHLAMACNILNAIGGNPRLNDPDHHPVFPCALPGHSKTNNAFSVQLNRCCPASIYTFLKIELPGEIFGTKHSEDGWCTIGEFYDEVETLIKCEELDDSEFNHGRQVGNNFNPAKGVLYEVHNREQALQALDEIIDQGEGHSGKMYDKDHQLTHYWKFKSVLELMENDIWDYHSEVYNMAADPDEKYFSDEAKNLNLQFNIVWTQMLDELNSAFNSETPQLDTSIKLMFHLKKFAVALMQIPLVNKSGNAGPTFRYLVQDI